MAAKRSNSGGTRLRPMSCESCGYHVYGTRAWMTRGLPSCSCGGRILPTKGADLAFIGMIGQDDVPRTVWTAICRENGWEDCIVRTGNAFKAWERNASSHLDARRHGAAHCAHPGCGLWVKDGAEFCNAGHAQSDDVGELVAAIPF